MMRPIGLLAGVLLAAAGCSSAEPRPTSGEFVLQTVNGEPLPAIVLQGEFATVTMLADTILLFEDGTGLRIQRRHVDDDIVEVPDPGPLRRDVMEFTYRYVDNRFELEYPCPGLALCVAPPHFVGEFSGAGLVGQEAGIPDKVLVYSIRGTALTRR